MPPTESIFIHRTEQYRQEIVLGTSGNTGFKITLLYTRLHCLKQIVNVEQTWTFVINVNRIHFCESCLKRQRVWLKGWSNRQTILFAKYLTNGFHFGTNSNVFMSEKILEFDDVDQNLRRVPSTWLREIWFRQANKSHAKLITFPMTPSIRRGSHILKNPIMLPVTTDFKMGSRLTKLKGMMKISRLTYENLTFDVCFVNVNIALESKKCDVMAIHEWTGFDIF